MSSPCRSSRRHAIKRNAKAGISTQREGLDERVARRLQPSVRSAMASTGGDARQRGDYGYDAPYALVAFAAVAIVSAIVAVVSWTAGLPRFYLRLSLLYALFFGINAASFWYTTRRGKFQVWDAILD